MILLAIALSVSPAKGCTDVWSKGCALQELLATVPEPVLIVQGTVQDNGYGVCPAFQHSHSNAPGQCFDNDDNLMPDTERRVLPVPAKSTK